MRSFPAASAPGPSGLRVQHVRDACSPGHVDKPTGGARPIAIGELLRRLTGKCLPGSCSSLPRLGWPCLRGLKLLSTRQGPGSTGIPCPPVKLDFENAFKTIWRNKLLGAVQSHLPSLSRWVSWCYGKPSNLQFESAILQFGAGVQQGDLLGPLLFAAALQPLAVTDAQLAAHLPNNMLRAPSGESLVRRSFELLGATFAVEAHAARKKLLKPMCCWKPSQNWRTHKSGSNCCGLVLATPV